MAKTPEGEIQAYGAWHLQRRGCLVRKLSYEGRRGCPDHLVVAPGGRVLFIEYKRGEDIGPEPHQLREHERLRQHGADVRVIGSKAQVDELIKELFNHVE